MAENSKKHKISKTKSDIETTDSKEVFLKYTVADDMLLTFSDGVTVQHTQNEFILSFFQITHPLLLSEEARQNISEVESRCVARIVLTPHQMAQTRDALNVNFERWARKMKVAREDKADETE